MGSTTQPGPAAAVEISCTRCRSKWTEDDIVALAGLEAGLGVRCPGCGTIVERPAFYPELPEVMARSRT